MESGTLTNPYRLSAGSSKETFISPWFCFSASVDFTKGDSTLCCGLAEAFWVCAKTEITFPKYIFTIVGVNKLSCIWFNVTCCCVQKLNPMDLLHHNMYLYFVTHLPVKYFYIVYVSTVSSICLVHVEIDIKMDLTLLDLTLWEIGSNIWNLQLFLLNWHLSEIVSLERSLSFYNLLFVSSNSHNVIRSQKRSVVSSDEPAHLNTKAAFTNVLWQTRA